MVVDLYLVRHGEAAANWGQSADPGLSELGFSQAQAAADTLQAAVDADVLLVSSPLQRAQQTAAALAELLNKPVEIDARYREVPSTVDLSERHAWLKQFMQQNWQQQPDLLLDWRAEMLKALAEAQQSSVIFTHFLVLNAIVGQLQQRDEVLCYRPDNASVTHVRNVDGQLQLVSLGRELETLVN